MKDLGDNSFFLAVVDNIGNVTWMHGSIKLTLAQTSFLLYTNAIVFGEWFITERTLVELLVLHYVDEDFH